MHLLDRFSAGTCVAALLCAQGMSCGGASGPIETCVVPDVSYQGSAAGPAYLKIRGDRGLMVSSSGVSFPLLAEIVNGKAFCYVTPDSSTQTVDAMAWIDGSGASATDCADVTSAACQPSPADPQVHRTASVAWGERKIIALQISGP